MSCQKVVNVLAVASAVVSLTVVGTAGYVFVNREALVDNVKKQVMDSVLGGGLGSGGLTPELPTGTNDLSPSAPQVSVPQQQAATLQ